jgi:hypothetical protein
MPKHEDHHTPAPWFASVGNQFAIIRGPDGDSIATMALTTPDRPNPKEQIANAHILGAGAQLLAALEALLARAKGIDGPSHDEIVAAQLAVDQARGRSP